MNLIKEKNMKFSAKKAVRTLLSVAFVIYCVILLYILFLSRGFRTHYPYFQYFKFFTNFVPFKTIVEYINIFGKGFQFLSVLNLLGNFVLFMPMGMLLPCLFKGLDRFWKVTLYVLIIVVAVEVLQFVLRAGVIDIDDVIFNLCGAMIGYGIIKIPFINKLLKRFYFIVESKQQEVVL